MFDIPTLMRSCQIQNGVHSAVPFYFQCYSLLLGSYRSAYYIFHCIFQLQQFQFPVNKTQNPGYGDVIVNPINLSKIENNIDTLVYTNSESFLSDIKWILHNCSIYFSGEISGLNVLFEGLKLFERILMNNFILCIDNYKVTRAAKSLQKVSKQEVGDIETCPECYLNANTMTDNWFTETCAKPHLILWAKLKGFPYWPAKAMSINSTLVDVRFFGEHDRANIPSKDCYLYSREDPNPPTNKYKRNTIADCVKVRYRKWRVKEKHRQKKNSNGSLGFTSKYHNRLNSQNECVATQRDKS